MSKLDIRKIIDEYSDELVTLSKSIWNNPETSYNEVFASSLQKDFLKKYGFNIIDVKGMETAFIAEYGEGKPIIGILGEYDGLDNLSQKVSFSREAVLESAPGHGCGHNLLGVGSIGAALAIKTLIDKGELKGTIRYYGCPGEEELSGKVYMAKKGCFRDLSCALSWHPFDVNIPMKMGSLASYSVKFKFKGIASHAGQSPHTGRSALDAVELMHVGVNYLREHVIDKIRIHYIITKGGERPNIVPGYAEEWMFIRGPKASDVKDTLRRIENIAKGAALMTETKMEYEVISGVYDYRPNRTLIEVLDKNYREIGVPKYNEKEVLFAEKLGQSLSMQQRRDVITSVGGNESLLSENIHSEVGDFNNYNIVATGSFDLGDVSYIVPTAQISAAAWPLGTPAHTWQSTAASGSTLGFKAMINASKVLGYSAYDLFEDSKLLDKAWKEFEDNTKDKYKALTAID